MNQTDKAKLVQDLKEKVGGASSLYLTDFTGLSVKDMVSFRRNLKAAGVEYVVVKNTLATRAFKAASIEGLDEMLQGPTGIVVSQDDPIGAARIIKDFQKEHKKPQVKAGFLDGKVISASAVERLAMLPGRDGLLEQLAGYFQGPLQCFLGAMNGMPYQLVGVLESLKNQRQAAE